MKKIANLLLISLVTLASCRASLEQHVFKELPARAENEPVLLLKPDKIVSDTATTVAEITINVNGSNYEYRDVAQVLLTQTRELGGDMVQINQLYFNTFFGGLGKAEATVYHSEKKEYDEEYLNMIRTIEQALMRPYRYIPTLQGTVNIGYSYDFSNKGSRINPSYNTVEELSHGLVTQVKLSAMLAPQNGIEFMYDRFFSDSKLSNGKIKNNNTYLGVNWIAQNIVRENWLLKSHVGLGYMAFKMDAQEGNYTAKIAKADGFGLSFGMGVDYLITKSFGVGLQADLLLTSFGTMLHYGEYGGATLSKGPYSLNRVNISEGIRYYFGEAKPNLKPNIISMTPNK